MTVLPLPPNRHDPDRDVELHDLIRPAYGAAGMIAMVGIGLALACLWLLMSGCATRRPVPRDPAVFDSDCRAIWLEELGRPIDPSSLLGCEAMMNNAAIRGEHPAQEVYRRWLRAQPEWVARHQHGHAGETGPLRVQGEDFVDQQGHVWHARGATAFLLYDRFQRGEDIDRQLEWYVRHGRNLVRVFVAGVAWLPTDRSGDGLPPWCPICTPATRTPDLSWRTLQEFFDLLASHGLRVEASVVTGDNRSFDEWRAVLQQVYDAAAGRPNVFVEAVNEPWNGWAVSAGLDPQALLRGIDRHGVLSAYGYEPQWSGEEALPSPHLDYVTWHSPRDGPHFPHNGKDAWGIRNAQHVPVWDDEPLGFADFNKQGGGARTTDGEAMAAHFATCAIFAGGCTWHFEVGLWGDIPAPGTITEAIAQRLQAVTAFYSPNAHTGAYARAGLGDFGLAYAPGDSRVNHAYGMIRDGVQWVVVPLPRPGWVASPVNGWRILTWGPEQGMLALTR